MQLASEDMLRLNVLLAQPLQALRINESTMTVHALTAKGEAKVQLHPTVHDTRYLRWVRELISTKVTGSPGGYPVFLQRWTRMGQNTTRLEQLLLLGEPEAVVAVVHAPQLSAELARRAWWAEPTPHNARRLLEKPDVVGSELGQVLAAFLLEFLPFEAIPLDMADTVHLCLQGELISTAEQKKLWNRARRKQPFYVGFLLADSRTLPLSDPAHPSHAEVCTALAPALAADNPFAHAFSIALSAGGRRWLRTLLLALEKPADQEVVIALFQAIQKRFNLPFPESRGVRDMALAQQRAAAWSRGEHDDQGHACPQSLQTVVQALPPALQLLLEAWLLLAQMGEDSLVPVFGGSDAVGSVMRKHLEPLSKPVSRAAVCLLGAT
ncbi:MAG: hypothetical protein KDI15_10330 [Thiothrix sp.]|nr:hypothetical protein [Thiothrix sp.]HPE60251.1 hypothetical protein [Thiolinea sp.]